MTHSCSIKPLLHHYRCRCHVVNACQLVCGWTVVFRGDFLSSLYLKSHISFAEDICLPHTTYIALFRFILFDRRSNGSTRLVVACLFYRRNGGLMVEFSTVNDKVGMVIVLLYQFRKGYSNRRLTALIRKSKRMYKSKMQTSSHFTHAIFIIKSHSLRCTKCTCSVYVII